LVLKHNYCIFVIKIHKTYSMKKIVQISSLVLGIFLTFTGFAQVSSKIVITEPIKYNDFIVEQQNQIGNGIVALIAVFGDTNGTKTIAIEKLNIVLKSTSEAIDNISKLKAINPDYGLKENALNLFTFYKRTMGSTYFTVIDEIYSDQPDTDKLNELVNSISAEEAGYDNAFQTSQQEFADEYDFTLETNELQEKFE